MQYRRLPAETGFFKSRELFGAAFRVGSEALENAGEPESLTQREFAKHADANLDALYAYALRLAGQPEGAAELVQETFVKALDRLDAFREPEAVRPMLFTILYHCFVDEWRKQKRRPQLVVLGDAEASISTPETAQSLPPGSIQSIREAMGEEVDAALNALDEQLRTTLWLREIENFSYAEIAAIVDAPIGTVRSRLARARSQMAAQLKEYASRRGFPRVRHGKQG